MFGKSTGYMPISIHYASINIGSHAQYTPNSTENGGTFTSKMQTIVCIFEKAAMKNKKTHTVLLLYESRHFI